MQPFRRPPAVGQFPHDAGGGALDELSEGFVHNGSWGSNDACNVFQTENSRTAIVCDLADPEEQSAALAFGEPLAGAGNGEVGARESGNDAIHPSAPCCAVEGFKIVPNRCRM